MGLSKKQRIMVLEKSGGKCWYCGGELPEKWHADHFEPVDRISKIAPDTRPGSSFSHRFVPTGEMRRPENDHIGNIVPACVSCNLFKSVCDVETFRRMLEAQVKTNRQRFGFRMGEIYGLIKVEEKSVIFWFETQNF